MSIIRSILAITDLRAGEDVAIQRASQLAGKHRSSLKLMYLPPPGEAAHPAAGARLLKAARQIQETLGLRVRTAPTRDHRLEHIAVAARGMDLVVLPNLHERSTAAFFRGQPVLRVLRRCGCAVLVARRVRGEHYRRVLVAVDLSDASQSLVDLAAHVDPPAELEIFHAIGTRDEAKLRSAEAPERAMHAYRERRLRQARQRVVALGASLTAGPGPVSTLVGRGDPARQIVVRQEHSGAELVVLGKRRSSAWEDFLCGSVAHSVLSWGSSDVLVVPDGYQQATARFAAQRMRAISQPALQLQGRQP